MGTELKGQLTRKRLFYCSSLSGHIGAVGALDNSLCQRECREAAKAALRSPFHSPGRGDKRTEPKDSKSCSGYTFIGLILGIELVRDVFQGWGVCPACSMFQWKTEIEKRLHTVWTLALLV